VTPGGTGRSNPGHLSEIGTHIAETFAKFRAAISFLTEVVAVFDSSRNCALGCFFCDFFSYFSWHEKRTKLVRVTC
jgi:hypothetical protein